MKRKLLITVFTAFTVYSCNNKHDLFHEFQVHSVKGVKYYQEGKVNPSSTTFEYLQDKIYWLDYNQGDFLFSTATPPDNNNAIGNHKIKKGKGPDEFMMVVFLQRNKEYLSFVDNFKGALFFCNADTLFNEFQLSGFAPFEINGIAKVSNNNYLYSGLLNDGRFVLCDSDQTIHSKYTMFPGAIDELPHETIEKNMACQNHFTVNGDAFANIIYDSGIIEFFQIKEDSIIKVRENIYNDFQFSISEDPKIARSQKSNTGFIDICSDEKYVYTLYSTVSWEENAELAYFGDYVFIYEWDGTPVKALQLDAPLRGFSTVPGTNKFWGWSHDNEGIYFAEYEY